MKIAFALLVLVAAVSARPDGDSYTDKYDNIDVEKILPNDRLRDQYLKCLMGDGTCTAEGKTLKDILPDALATECSKCTEKQKAGAEKVIKYLIEKHPEEFKQLEAKYDKNGVYRKKYNEEAKKRGIDLA